MSSTLTDRSRQMARTGLSRTLRTATAPARTLARTVIRHRPDLEPRLANRGWLWQPGWGHAYHARLYRSADPYGVDGSPYEQSKYDLIMTTLGGLRAERTLEVGCAEGALSSRLVMLSDELVGVDIASIAVARARARLGDDRRARFECRALPFDMPAGTFDLIVCSDVLYYWDGVTLPLGLARLLDRLRPGGRLLLLHYLGDFGQPSPGDTVHDAAVRLAGRRFDLLHLVEHRTPGPDGRGARLDVLVRQAATGDGAVAIPQQRSPVDVPTREEPATR